MNYQRMSTVCLSYWHVFGKEEKEEWGCMKFIGKDKPLGIYAIIL